MKNKTSLLGIVIMLGLCLTPLSTIASGDNSLVQLDIKKSSDNSLDMTFFTTGASSENVVVRKKSDNKYVILVPNVTSSGYSRPNLNGVKEMISNVDIKSVEDGANGYTKVTIITTKPLNIKTHTQKTSPVTAQQKEYESLIAEANAIKNKTAANSEPQKPVPTKTEITVNKADTKPAVKTETKQTATPKKPEIKLTEVNPKTIEQPKTVKTEPATIRERLINKIDGTDVLIIPELPASAPTATAETNNTVENAKDIKDLKQAEKVSLLSQAKTMVGNIRYEVTRRLPANIPPIALFGLIPLIGLMIIAKLIKVSLDKSKDLRAAFAERMLKNPPLLNRLRYNNIVNDADLTWQDKYKKFLEESSRKEMPIQRPEGKGNYAFIKGTVADNEIEQKRQSLENMLNPDMASESNQIIRPETIEVHSEEDAIRAQLKKAIKKPGKFKGFENPLNHSRRDRVRNRKSRFKRYEQVIEVKENADLNKSMLSTNPRQLKEANLNVSKLVNDKRRYAMKDYVMSSLDEFFEVMDGKKSVDTADKAIKMKKATNPLVSGLSKIKPLPGKNQFAATSTDSMNKPVIDENKQITDPISRTREETKESYMNDLVIKSGFNVDDNRGFYIVNVDKNSALVGKINDEIFILKKFDKSVDSPIQVRHDKDNVYMVKADNFKSLVEIGEEKMGVLIEL